jgi:hypothetical protein
VCVCVCVCLRVCLRITACVPAYHGVCACVSRRVRVRACVQASAPACERSGLAAHVPRPFPPHSAAAPHPPTLHGAPSQAFPGRAGPGRRRGGSFIARTPYAPRRGSGPSSPGLPGRRQRQTYHRLVVMDNANHSISDSRPPKPLHSPARDWGSGGGVRRGAGHTACAAVRSWLCGACASGPSTCTPPAAARGPARGRAVRAARRGRARSSARVRATLRGARRLAATVGAEGGPRAAGAMAA